MPTAEDTANGEPEGGGTTAMFIVGVALVVTAAIFLTPKRGGKNKLAITDESSISISGTLYFGGEGNARLGQNQRG